MEEITMKALQSFKGREGFIRTGQEFAVNGEKRAEELHYRKYAEYVSERKEAQAQGMDLEAELKELNSHAKVNNFVNKHNLENIPSQDEGAKLEERKAAIREALENGTI